MNNGRSVAALTGRVKSLPSEIDDPVGIVANTQKSYATVDLMAQYRPTKNLRFTLNANNLFDQKYKTIPDALSSGAPRHVMATFRYEF